MKINNRFDDYTKKFDTKNLHPKHKEIYETFPERIREMQNLIFYGPPGVGKYTQSLASIKKYSPSNLNYEKKICVNSNKQQYYIKISDIHYEVDMSMLGCNTKVLWNDIYNHIMDIVLTKTNDTGIILCKNFNSISNELLDIFYSYMQTKHKTSAKIIFILLTTDIGFIPDNIIDRSNIIPFSRPSRKAYENCIQHKLDDDIKLESITNINSLHMNIKQLMNPHNIICNKLINQIINIETSKFSEIREILYDIFIYDLQLEECIIYIITELIKKKKIKTKDIPELFKKNTIFLQYYNNNYRPIYHLESFIYYLTSIVHGFD